MEQEKEYIFPDDNIRPFPTADDILKIYREMGHEISEDKIKGLFLNGL